MRQPHQPWTVKVAVSAGKGFVIISLAHAEPVAFSVKPHEWQQNQIQHRWTNALVYLERWFEKAKFTRDQWRHPWNDGLEKQSILMRNLPLRNDRQIHLLLHSMTVIHEARGVNLPIVWKVEGDAFGAKKIKIPCQALDKMA